MEMIKAAPELASALKYLRETLLPAIMADGVISADEWSQIENFSENLANNLDSKFGPLMDIFQDEQSRQATSKGIATASQDTVDELNGRATAIQGHTFDIRQGTNILVANSERILLHLAGIESNTARLHSMDTSLLGMRDEMRAVKDTINDIALKGIKVK